MIRLIGILLTLCGCVGYGFCSCFAMEDRNKRIIQLSNLFERLSNCVAFEKLTLLQALEETAKKIEEPGKAFLEGVCDKVTDKEFAEAWKEGCEKFEADLPEELYLEMKELFCKNMSLDCYKQQKQFLDFADSLRSYVDNHKEKQLEKQTLVKSTSVILGIVICVVLW